jgi:hypothetical protein
MLDIILEFTAQGVAGSGAHGGFLVYTYNSIAHT